MESHRTCDDAEEADQTARTVVVDERRDLGVVPGVLEVDLLEVLENALPARPGTRAEYLDEEIPDLGDVVSRERSNASHFPAGSAAAQLRLADHESRDRVVHAHGVHQRALAALEAIGEAHAVALPHGAQRAPPGARAAVVHGIERGDAL